MNDIEVVDVAPADMEHFVRTAHGFWGEAPEPGMDQVAHVLDRAWLARLDGEDVGAAAVIDFALALPGGLSVPMDGVTWVAVSATARRHGALRALMERSLQSARERGVPVLGLAASESVIYRRFGYGVASHIGKAEADTAHAALRIAFEDTGRARFVRLEDAIPLWRDVESRQGDRAGRILRSENHWRVMIARNSKPDGQIAPMAVVAHEDASGVVDGFVNYRLELRWKDGLPDGVIHVNELTALNPVAHLALWQHVLLMDLVEHLEMWRFGLDDPIRHLLADPRRMHLSVRDDLHLRIVDVVAALESRRYAREDGLVIEVRDGVHRDIAGRYRVEGGLDGASASRVEASPDIALDAAALGSVLLGDTSVASLHHAAIVDELTDGAVRRASAMFSWSPRPWLNHMF
ncbi:MAG: GNAT family N-acetyltransferase [Candidatus Dormibacteraeota bacterium]|nr:GNAT family N-acetyltransferase [Candidatus Dormibacteraeota bacterium]